MRHPRGLCLLEFVDRRMLERQLSASTGSSAPPSARSEPHFDRSEAELSRYFAGDLAAFSVPLVPQAPSSSREVWSASHDPATARHHHSGRASELGRPTGAIRAVARAMGDNRIAILVPCHRVVGSDGSLTGYGGGLWRKQKLLSHEAGEKLAGPWTADDRVSASR